VHVLQKVFIAIGALAILVGAIWIGQGSGLLPGSSMTGDRTWLGIGLAVGCVGLALVYVALQRPRMGSRRPRPAQPEKGDGATGEPPVASPPKDAL
jgi:hypothetical protein